MGDRFSTPVLIKRCFEVDRGWCVFIYFVCVLLLLLYKQIKTWTVQKQEIIFRKSWLALRKAFGSVVLKGTVGITHTGLRNRPERLELFYMNLSDTNNFKTATMGFQCLYIDITVTKNYIWLITFCIVYHRSNPALSWTSLRWYYEQKYVLITEICTLSQLNKRLFK